MGLAFSQSDVISIKKFLSSQIAIASGSNKYFLCKKTTVKACLHRTLAEECNFNGKSIFFSNHHCSGRGKYLQFSRQCKHHLKPGIIRLCKLTF